MHLKEMQHEGNEEFSSFPDRKKVAKIVKKIDKKKKDEAHERQEKLQEAWLSVSNPFIFDGDPDC